MSHSAGCRRIAIDGEAGTISALVMYPADAPERTVPLPPYSAELAMDAAVAAGVHALVVISHGRGSWNLLHRRLAAHLARNGFVVAMPVHPGDNREDQSLTDTPANLFARPRHLGAVVDHVLADPELGGALLPDRIGVIGHSLGGYTALAFAGAVPTTLPDEEPDGTTHPLAVASDPRVAALVLLAPAAAWFREPGALDAVAVPVLMMSGDRDEITTAWHAGLVEKGLGGAAPLEHRLVAGAGHFSFLSPYPPEMIGPDAPRRSIPRASTARRSTWRWRARSSTSCAACSDARTPARRGLRLGPCPNARSACSSRTTTRSTGMGSPERSRSVRGWSWPGSPTPGWRPSMRSAPTRRTSRWSGVDMAGLGGIDLTTEVVRMRAPTCVLLLSASPEDVYEAVAAGAAGYLIRGAAAEGVCLAVEAVARGRTVLSEAAQDALVRCIRERTTHVRPVLSEREHEVLELTAEGMSAPQIAATLHLSPTTVKSHLHGAYEKLGVSDRAAAVAVAIRSGLLE